MEQLNNFKEGDRVVVNSKCAAESMWVLQGTVKETCLDGTTLVRFDVVMGVDIATGNPTHNAWAFNRYLSKITMCRGCSSEFTDDLPSHQLDKEVLLCTGCYEAHTGMPPVTEEPPQGTLRKGAFRADLQQWLRGLV